MSSSRRSAMPEEMVIAPRSSLVERRFRMRVLISSRILKRRSTNEDLGAITISAGVAERLPSETPTALIERADEALYVSKHAGRNRTSKAAAPAKPKAA